MLLHTFWYGEFSSFSRDDFGLYVCYLIVTTANSSSAAFSLKQKCWLFDFKASHKLFELPPGKRFYLVSIPWPVIPANTCKTFYSRINSSLLWYNDFLRLHFLLQNRNINLSFGFIWYVSKFRVISPSTDFLISL